MRRRTAYAVLIATLSAGAADIAVAKDLLLVKESTIAALVGQAEDDDELEASGVYALEGRYYVVFDNKKVIAVIDDQSWSANGSVNPDLNEFIGGAEKTEGITYAPDGKAWFLVEEERLRSEDDKRSQRNGRVFEYVLKAQNVELKQVDKSWLPFNFQRANKGFEGLSLVRHQGEHYLLALCEGNDCDAGDMGKKPGNGRIKVFAHDRDEFEYLASIDLPRSLPFVDYSGMDVQNGLLVVVSQETSAVWIGLLDPGEWQVEDGGSIYWFPTAPDGTVSYCNVEGVSWIDEDTLVFVSDARKKDEQPASCAAKEQSIHVFRIPNR